MISVLLKNAIVEQLRNNIWICLEIPIYSIELYLVCNSKLYVTLPFLRTLLDSDLRNFTLKPPSTIDDVLGGPGTIGVGLGPQNLRTTNKSIATIWSTTHLV